MRKLLPTLRGSLAFAPFAAAALLAGCGEDKTTTVAPTDEPQLKSATGNMQEYMKAKKGGAQK